MLSLAKRHARQHHVPTPRVAPALMYVHDPDDQSLLPYDSDAFDPRAPQKPRPAVLGDAPFAYIGKGLTLDQFENYISTYDFGKVKPDYIIFHHTANPDASWAPIGNDPRTKWDRGEAGASLESLRVKRLGQIAGLRNYYASLGWSAGPHLFIDDRFIWLFSPMNTVGVHAKWGNSFRAHTLLHYSVGIEVVGYYERVQWPAALQTRLAIAPEYMYPVNKPGMKIVKGEQVCARPELLRFGGLSSHRDYNKPECPGSAITEAFYTSVVKGAPASPSPVSLPPVDKFARWGDVGRPIGAAVDFSIPKAWLVNQKLGACVVPEHTSDSQQYAVAEFEHGIIVYYVARREAEVRLF
jgi:hypothetical protein